MSSNGTLTPFNPNSLSDAHFIYGLDKYTIKNISLPIDKNICNIPKYASLCTFQYICIKQKDDKQRLKSFSFYIDDKCIIIYFVDFLEETIKDFITIIGNTILYKFPNEMLFGPFRLIYRQNVSIELNFENNNNILEKSLCVQFCSYEINRTMVDHPHNDKIIQIYKSLYMGIEKNVITHVISLKGLTNGFVVRCNNVNNIKNIRLLINNRELLNYDTTKISMLTKRYSSTALYISLTDSNDVFRKDFCCAINMNHNTTIEIQFNEPTDKLCIFTLIPNVLKYENGLSYTILNDNHEFEQEFHNSDTILDDNFDINPEFSNSNIVLDDYFDKPNVIDTNYTNLNINYFKNSLNTTSLQVDNILEIYKECDNDKCTISLTIIKKNDKYMQCSKCKKCFHKKPLIKWFKLNNTCPYCVSNWNNMIVYINKNDRDNDNDNDNDKPTVTSLLTQLKSYIPYKKSKVIVISWYKQLKSYINSLN